MTARPNNATDDSDAAPAFDAGEQHSVETRAKRAKRQQRERDTALGALLDLREGRALVWELLSRSHIMHTSVMPGQTPEMTAFREGERNIGLALLHDVLRVRPSAFAQMQTEAQQAAQRQ